MTLLECDGRGGECTNEGRWVSEFGKLLCSLCAMSLPKEVRCVRVSDDPGLSELVHEMKKDLAMFILRQRLWFQDAVRHYVNEANDERR